MNSLFRFPFLFLLVVILTFTTYAFASSQTGQPMGGEGVSAVSGWNISGVHYRLADDPSKLAAVEFDLDAPADVVRASVNSSVGGYFSCQNSVGYHWVCNIDSSVSVSDMTELKVVATGG